MAIYIPIRRLTETDAYVEYGFGRSESSMGTLRIDKLTGDVILIIPAPGDLDQGMFLRAEYKLKKYWTTGVFPEKTCWAS